MFEIGKAYLVALTNGWVFLGRYLGPVPFGHRWENAAYVVNTGGVPWNEFVQSADKRAAADLRKFPGGFCCGLTILWSTDLAGAIQ